jgi:hypothetical protein
MKNQMKTKEMSRRLSKCTNNAGIPDTEPAWSLRIGASLVFDAGVGEDSIYGSYITNVSPASKCWEP